MITNFFGEYRFLSNFFVRDVEVRGLMFMANEHAYVAAKTTNFDDLQLVSNVNTPGQVKKVGRKIELRPDWEDVKIPIMYEINKAKYDQHDDLRTKLIYAVHDKGYLLEGNTWGDRIWGAERITPDQHKQMLAQPIERQHPIWITPEEEIWAGANYLGRILVRLACEYAPDSIDFYPDPSLDAQLTKHPEPVKLFPTEGKEVG